MHHHHENDDDRDQDFLGEDAALTIRARHELLAENAAERFADHLADLVALVADPRFGALRARREGEKDRRRRLEMPSCCRG